VFRHVTLPTLEGFGIVLSQVLVCARMTSRFPTPAEFLSFPKPNYVDPETRLPLALAVVIPMTVLVSSFISCRFYSRTIIISTLGWDDWIMFAAAVSLLLTSAKPKKNALTRTATVSG
jgi:hypothetical protein